MYQDNHPIGTVAYGETRGHVIRQVDQAIVDLVASDQIDQELRGFYIRLGRYLLDRSFVLNSR
jgi:hypothetical protein